MTDPKTIEAAARESYFADRTDVADESHVKNYCSGFKAGYAKAAKDMVPMEVVQKLVDSLESISAPHLTDDELLKCDYEVVVEDTKIAREALAEFKTWKARRG